MANDRPSNDFLRQQLQAVVDKLCLLQGSVNVTVHEGRISKLEISPDITVILGDSNLHKATVTIQLFGLVEFVQEEIEPIVLQATGPYGNVKVEVKYGKISRWEVCEKHKVSALPFLNISS